MTGTQGPLARLVEELEFAVLARQQGLDGSAERLRLAKQALLAAPNPRAFAATDLGHEALMRIAQAGVDVTGAEHVDVSWSGDKTKLWVNINGVCLLRACQIRNLVVGRINDGQDPR